MMISLFDIEEKIVEKEKMVVISIFSFFHSVFQSLLLKAREKSGLIV